MIHPIVRRLFVAGALGAFGACLPTVTVADVTPHHLRLTTNGGDITTLNRHLSSQYTVSLLSQLTAAYLVRFDTNNRPVPELALELPTKANGGISADGKTITWHLRHGVRWSDGAPFSADDVVFTTNKVILNPANNDLSYSDFKDAIVSVAAPDRFTVVYRLTKAQAFNIPTFFSSAGANPSILPKHLLQNYATINQAPYNALPVGIGPFRFTSWVRSDRVEMEANPYYWRGQPKLKRLTFFLAPPQAVAAMIEAHDVDLVFGSLDAQTRERLAAAGKIKVLSTPAMGFYALGFNVLHPIAGDVRVREAVRLAIDRKALVRRRIVHGFATTGESVVPPGLVYTPPAPPSIGFDPAGARSLLDRAGWIVQSDGIRAKAGQRLTLALSYEIDQSPQDPLVEYLRQALRDVGIEIESKAVASARFWDQYASGGELYRGSWDMTFLSWQFPASGDLDNLLACNQFPPAGQNVDRFCDPAMDRILAAFSKSSDPATRRALLGQEMQILATSVPWIPLEIPASNYAFDPRLTGFQPNTLTPLDAPMMMNVDLQ
jgi:peptide/nickel transport system substrate-binding protein